MKSEHSRKRNPADQSVRVQQPEQGTKAGVQVLVGIQRDTAHQVRDRYAPQNWRQPGAEDNRAVAPGAPVLIVDFEAPFQPDDTDNQRHQNQEERQVEAGKHRRIPFRKRREERAASGN